MEQMMPYIWLAVIVVMSLVEASTAQLVSIWFVLGAIVSLIVSVFVPSVLIQLAVFVLVALITLVCTRPFVKKLMHFKKEDTNLGRYIGKTALVIKDINNELGEGQVNVSGSIWTARSVNGEIIETGKSVVVRSIEGVKLNVEAL